MPAFAPASRDRRGDLSWDYPDWSMRASTDFVYRGVTSEEWASIVRNRTVKSTQAYSLADEGTSFAPEASTALSYVQVGRDNPARTGRPIYMMEIRRQPHMQVDPRDGYVKTREPVPTSEVVRVWRFNPDGSVEEFTRGESGLGKPAINDYAAIHARFLDAVRHVWRNADFVLPYVRADYADRPPKADVHAALLVIGGRTRAIGDSVIQRAPAYALLVNPSIYDLPDDMIWRVLVHEAVHIGYSGHGEDFKRLVVEKGGVVAGAGVDTGGVVEVQKKVGARFKTVRTFPQEEQREAEAWAREQANAARARGTPERWRLQWG